MEHSADLPVADGTKHLGGFSDAITFLNEKFASTVRAINGLHRLTSSFVLEGVPDGGKDTRLSRLEEERKVLSAKMGQQSALLINLLGEDSKPEVMREYLQARDDLLAVVRAEALGILDTNESTEAIDELTGALAKAREAAVSAGHGGDVAGVEKGSVLQTGNLARMRARASEAQDLFLKAGKAGWQQIAGVGSGTLGLLRGTPLAGGIWGLMLFGYKEGDRLAAEAGEIANIASAAGESMSGPVVGRMAAFQEKAQRYYGISRREIQSNLSTYVEAGIKFDDIFRAQAGQIGEVGSSAVHLGLALDRHFEMGAGTTARMAAKAVSNYGMDLGAALGTISKIAFAASKVGVGASAFVGWVFQATGQVRNMGISLEDAAAAAASLAASYREKGVNAGAAGSLAQQGMGEFYGGLSRQGTADQIHLAKSVGLGGGLEGRQALKEGIQGRPDMQAKLMGTLYNDAMKVGQGNEGDARFYLEQKGYGFEGARAVIELGPKFAKGVRLEEITEADRKLLTDAFKTESQKTSDLEKNKKLMLEGMAESGRAAIAILTNFAAISIVGMKAIPVLLGGTQDEKERVYAALGRYSDGTLEAWNAMMAGSNKMLAGAGQTLLPLLRPVSRALAFKASDIRNPEMDRAQAPSEANTKNLLDNVFTQLTGSRMTQADEAVLTGVTGYSAAEIERLSGTQEGQEKLRASIQAARNRPAPGPAPNPVRSAGFSPGASAKGQPVQPHDPVPLIPGVDSSSGIGVGTLGKGPNRAEPLPAGVTAPGGPLGARIRVKDVRWDVPGGYRGPLEAEVEVTFG